MECNAVTEPKTKIANVSFFDIKLAGRDKSEKAEITKPLITKNLN